MKKIFIIVFLTFFYSLFYSQCHCAKNFGGHTDDSTLGIEKVSDGFIYNLDSHATNSEYPAYGQYLIKFDYNCNQIWKKNIQNTAFTVDSFDNIYTLTPDGYYQNYVVYVRKYDAKGNLLWEKKIKNAKIAGNIQNHLYINSNQLFVAGTFRYEMNFEDKVILQNGTIYNGGGHLTKGFVASYTTDGDFIDAKSFGDGIKETIQNFDIDNNGNIYLTYNDWYTFKIHKINSNLQNILIKTYEAPIGMTRIPTVLHFNTFNSKLYSYDVYGPINNIFKNSIITEYDPITLNITKSLNFNNNSQLEVPNDEGNGLPLFLNRMYFVEENENEMYLFGQFRGSLRLNDTIVTSHGGGQSNDLILFKLTNSSFKPEFIFKSTSTDISATVNVAGKTFMKDGRIYLTGNFKYKKMLLNGSVFNNNSGNGDSDAFLYRYDTGNTGNLSSNSPVCIGSNIELKASGGTNYSWTGPNGFSSVLQNPIITNAIATDSGVYSCTITGTGGCDGTYTVNVYVGDNEKPIPNNPNLPKLTGDCKFVVTTIPTATDKCAGKITATTTDPLSYSLPGTYFITWTYNDGNGNIETQTQQIEITDQPKPTANAVQNLCAIDQPKLSDIQVVGTNLKWYDASGAILLVNTALVDNTKYYVTQNSAGCESSKLEILVNVSDPVAPSGNSLQNFCIGQNPTLADIKINGQNIKWYNASNILLAQTTPLVDGETYYATQTISSCESINKLAVKVAVNNSSISASNYVESAFCNDTTDDFKFINLNDHRTKLITNITGLQFTFYDSNNQLVPDFTKAKLNIGHNLFNVEIKNTVGCSQWFTLEFNLNKKPKLSLPPEVEFCSGIDTELNAGDCAGCTFLWNTGETSQIIKTQTEGTYNVTVTTEKTCQNSASIIVKKAKLATIKNIQIENNLVTITMSEAGGYLYSDDNINWQTSNQFKLENGNYTIYVKTKMGCLIDQRTISIFEIPNSFSPNADGINDTWKIKGLENYKDSQVIVLDRFGKKLFETKVTGIFEWNGKINEHPLPTDTYWYIINVSDGRSFKGFLVLKNRN